jgi:hypothetical protein
VAAAEPAASSEDQAEDAEEDCPPRPTPIRPPLPRSPSRIWRRRNDIAAQATAGDEVTTTTTTTTMTIAAAEEAAARRKERDDLADLADRVAFMEARTATG